MLAERLRMLRAKKNVRQADVAESVGISSAMYGYYEAGDKVPSLAIAKKLADYFDVTLDYLVGRE